MKEETVSYEQWCEDIKHLERHLYRLFNPPNSSRLPDSQGSIDNQIKTLKNHVAKKGWVF